MIGLERLMNFEYISSYLSSRVVIFVLMMNCMISNPMNPVRNYAIETSNKNAFMKLDELIKTAISQKDF